MHIKRTVLRVVASALVTGGVLLMVPASGLEPLNSRVYHVTEVDFADYASQPRDAFPTLNKRFSGKRFLEVFPTSTIKSIEVPGDEVASPTGLIVSVLNNARVEATKYQKNYFALSPEKITFADGKCLKISIVLDPADEHAIGLRTDFGEFGLQDLPKYKAALPKLHKGISRTELQSELGIDGGITAPFKYERYVVANSECSPKGDVVKFNLAFKPAGMSDAVYFLGKWVPPKQSPQDVLMRISPPYIEPPFYD